MIGMKKLLVFALCCISVITVFAKSEPIDPKYGIGTVPVNNIGRVEFVDEIAIPASVDLNNCYERILTWVKGRFTKPNVTKGEILSDNADSRRITLRIQQNLIFKNTALVTDLTKINYNLNFAVKEVNGKKVCTVTMTDISYVYEEEREGGGSFTAEEWITDDEAFNRSKTKFLKTTGKFRIKTIDLFEMIANQTKETIETL